MHDHRRYHRRSAFQSRGDGICYCKEGRLVFPVILILVVLVLPGTAQVQDNTVGTITVVSGKVTIKRPGSDQALTVSEGDELLVGDELTTADGAAVQMAFSDGAFINLFPGSSYRVNQYAFDPLARRRSARVKVLQGRARVVLYQALGTDSKFFLETGSALILPDLLGDFAVFVTGAGTEVASLTRPVRVRNSSNLVVGEIRVNGNEKTVVRPNRPPENPQPLPRQERKNYMQDIRMPQRINSGVSD